jgi:dihydroorotase
MIAAAAAHAQKYDLLIRNGHVIDPKNKIDSKMDIAIKDGKIAKVAIGLSPDQAVKVIDAEGLIIAPGLIDIHTHVFVGSKPETFADGFLSVSPGSPAEQDVSDMDAYMTSLVIKKYPDIIVGVKIGHYEGSDWTPFDRAIDAAARSNTPLFVECHLPQFPLEDQLKKMRPGDIITHSFEKIEERMPVVDENGKLRPFVKDAQKKGILFDLGHGGAGFWFSVAQPAMKEGLAPNTFGSDLHRFSMNAGMKDMLNIMSKYMAMGLSLEEVIERASWNAASSIHKNDLGNLSEGNVADIAVLRVWDLNGISAAPMTAARPGLK